MNLSLAFDINQDQYLIRTFNNKETSIDSIIDKNSEEQCDIEIFKKINILFSDEQEIKDLPFSAIKTSPNQLHITTEVAKNMVFDDAKNLATKISEENAIKTNLELINKLTLEANRLSSIFLQNREIFVLNLWKVIYKNLAAYDLRIMFQTIDPKDEKKLTNRTLTGEDLSWIKDSSKEELALFTDLQGDFGLVFNLVNYAPDNNELTITCTIKSTKLIIMAKVHNLSVLQKSVLNGMMNSICYFLDKK